jgi:hypothetical protein
MIKRRPTEYPPFIPRNAGDWLLLGAYTIFRWYETTVEGILRFQCGNPNCRHETMFNPHNIIPPGCMECGDEFDWEGTLIEKGKICPDCRTRYPKSANFCIFHGPQMIPLKEFEYRKR